MTVLEKIIILNNLEKENRGNRLEDKLKQQECYGHIEELFYPLTKTLNTNSEQTLRAIDWQNHELDKKTKVVEEAASQIQKSRSQISEGASKNNETQVIGRVFVDTITASFLHSIGVQTNSQLKLNLVDFAIRIYKMNAVNVTLEQGAVIVKDIIYESSDELFNFLTNPYISTSRKMKTKLKGFY